MSYEFDTTIERSNLMKRIHSKDTKVEIMLRTALWQKNVRYRKNYSELPGKPDIAITSKKIAVFIDGEFWHGFDWDNKKNKIKSNRTYWIPKIERTIQRDIDNTRKIEEMGWIVIRFWEKEVKHNLDECTNKVLDVINTYENRR